MSIGSDSVTIPIQLIVHFIIGILLLGFAGFLHGRSLDGWHNWRSIFDEVQPSLEAEASPLDRVLLGVGGCFGAVIGWSCVVILTILGFDQILFAGILWTWLMDTLGLPFG